ncbi:hypothetical protein TrVE_jg9709 [Triparma verrucosa]|uniref:J domain-containing protein n=1 Tax=Triparma verrucosa TaxID=1606542 RepID=A0A9W7FCJ9_9STRA|nr:hypothetical protein TrVE_jg9709 [Triparma verrucosa]
MPRYFSPLSLHSSLKIFSFPSVPSHVSQLDKQYRALARKYHPDKIGDGGWGGELSEFNRGEEFHLVKESYAIIKKYMVNGRGGDGVEDMSDAIRHFDTCMLSALLSAAARKDSRTCGILGSRLANDILEGGSGGVIGWEKKKKKRRDYLRIRRERRLKRIEGFNHAAAVECYLGGGGLRLERSGFLDAWDFGRHR